MTLTTSIFLSFPKPHLASQNRFIDDLVRNLSQRGLTARTLGVTDYDTDAPLTAIRRLMLESNGLLGIALRRTFHERSTQNKGSDISDRAEITHQDAWSTSIWVHVEPAMAHQLGLPILLLREVGVAAEGMLERGVAGLYSPEFDPNAPEDFFTSPEWIQIFRQWEARVHRVAESRGQPPKLY